MRRRLWVVVVCAGPLLAIIGFDLSLRLIEGPDPALGAVLRAAEHPPPRAEFVLDSDLGYRPSLSADSEYNENGIVRSTVSAPRIGAKRVLFIGDSVTHQGRIIRALAERYDQSKYQFLNAGVEGYDVIQEVGMYERFNRREKPDQVVLTLHNNDLYYAPMVYRSRDGVIFYYLFGQDPLLVQPKLFELSYLYRHLMRYRLGRFLNRAKAEGTLVPRTRDALKQLKGDLEASHISFKVILFPTLKPWADWFPEERESRRHANEILSELGIDHEDLFPIFERPLAEHEAGYFRLHDDDPWHPNDLAAKMIAEDLKARNFLN